MDNYSKFMKKSENSITSRRRSINKSVAVYQQLPRNKPCFILAELKANCGNIGRMGKLQVILLVILCLLPQKGQAFDLPFLSSPEKDAQAFIDKVVPEIVASWDEVVLARYAHPNFYQTSPRQKVIEYFFTYSMLGPLRKYSPAKGETMEIKTSSGQRYITGNYVAEANFEKGTASIHISIIKNNKEWRITAFQVNSDALAIMSDSAKPAQPANPEPDRDEMRKMATAFLKEQNEVVSRRSTDAIFSIAERFAAEGEKELALELYAKALKAEPANLARQLEYARLLLAKGQNEEAITILRLIHDMAEEADLLTQSAELLTDSTGSERPQSPSYPTAAEIILVPVGNPHPIILQELAPKLQKIMGMTVRLERKTVPLGKPERKLADQYTTAFFQEVSGKINTLQKDAIMTALSLDESRLQKPENQSRFLLKLFSLLGTDGESVRQNYEANLAQLGDEGQYEIQRLTEEMRGIVSYDESNMTKIVLGVSEKDLFMGEGNFLYGGTDAAYGVISYYRFSAAFNHEGQNRPRLISRLLKQALSTANFALDIPRCNTPYCARSFPQNLAEHDAKSEELCGKCRRRLEKYKEDPRSDTSDFEYSALGEKYRKMQKWDLAEINFQKVIDHHAERSAAAYHDLALTYFDQGRYSEADQAFRIYFNQSADENVVAEKDLQTAVAVGNNFYFRGQHETANRYFSRVLATDGQNIDALVFMGDFHKEKGDESKAKEFYLRALEIDPKGFLANSAMAYYLLDKHKSAEVKQYYEKALANIPKNAEKSRILAARYNLSREYLQQGANDKATEQLQLALAMKPDYPHALDALGRIYSKSGRLNEAIALFRKWVELEPTNAEAWNNLGYSHYLNTSCREAIKAYEKALQISPESGLFHYNKSLAHLAVQEFDLAIHHADAASDLGFSGDPLFYQALAPYRK